MINCSVTVMPVKDGKVGFIRRDKNDTFGGLFLPPGGRVEITDGLVIDGVMYYSVESAAIREFNEEVGVQLLFTDLKFFCSLTLSNGRVVISLYTTKDIKSDKLTFMGEDEIRKRRDEFAPGMADESIMLINEIGKENKKWK